MIWIDFAVIGLVAVCVIIGLLRGVGREVFSLAFWVLAAWVSLNFSRQFSVFLEQLISHPVARLFASFVALFIITLTVGGLIGFLLSALKENNKLTVINHLGGMIVGIVRGMVVVTVVMLLAGFTPLPKDSWWNESTLIPPFQLCAVWLRDHVSSGVAEYISYR